MKRWYVVQTQIRSETKALAHLQNQGIKAYLPRYQKTRRHARRVDVVLAPLFPSYLFVNMDVDLDHWRSINGTVGVIRLICNGDAPLSIPEGVIENIIAQENDENIVLLTPTTFTKGDVLCIKEGAFVDCTGLVEEMIDHNRVILLLDLLGQKVRVKAHVETLAAAG